MAMPIARTDHDEVRSIALRPVLEGGRWFWPIAIVLTIPVVGAIAAWIYQLTYGLQVTGLTDRVFWGVYIINLITFIGFSYGGALVSAILRLTNASWRAPITRLAEATALITLCIGALFIFTDLGHPERAFQFLTSPNGSSPLVWDALAVTTYLLATMIFLYLPLIPDLASAAESPDTTLGPLRRRLFRFMSVGWQGLPGQRRALESAMTAIAILIIPIAVTVHSVLSWAFALTSREGWHSTIFGPYFVIAALYSGVAMVILVILVFRKAYSLEQYIQPKQIVNLGYIMLVLGMVYIYFTFTELLTEGYLMGDKTARLFELLLLGSYGPQFWFFVIAGVVVPVALVALPWTRNMWGIGTAAFLVLNDMWLKRFLIIVPPQSVPLIAGDIGVYQPTWTEGLITFGGMCAIPLLLMFFFRVFPVLSIYEMEELAGGKPHGGARGHLAVTHRGE